MDSLPFFILILISIAITETGSATTQEPLSCATIQPPCVENQYCLNSGAAFVCMSCDPSCVSCYGSGNNACQKCQLGYRNASGNCVACPENYFGANCAGECHCLYGASDCNVRTGECLSLQCDLGYTGIPTCQEPCSNQTYGSDCKSTCHCPEDDTCLPANGLCSGGSCAEGWSGGGCQNELPQLGDPVEVVNNTCENVTLVWQGWKSGEDRGSTDADIARYDVHSQYELDSGSYSDWTLVYEADHVPSQDGYQQLLTNLVPDTHYKFRVDVRQLADNKILPFFLPGKVSRRVFIPCTETTTTTTTTSAPTTTPRPGPHLIDDNEFRVDITENPITVEITWGVLDAAANYTLNLTLTYYLVKVMGTDCPLKTGEIHTEIEVEKFGSYNISGLLPWREYVVQLYAESTDYNLTDSIGRSVFTPEQVPTGDVTTLHVQSANKNGGFVTWHVPSCSHRNGELLHYKIDVYRVSQSQNTAVLTDTTNDTLYEITGLVPYTTYGVSVVYVNSIGPGPELTTIPEFTTLEDGQATKLSKLTDFALLEDVPGAPSIASVTGALTSLTVTLLPPSVTNGELLEYKVTWDTVATFTSPRHIGQPVSAGTDITLIGLEPDTRYFVKASARTSVGEGPFSEVRNSTTLASLPGQPINIVEDNLYRNTTCTQIYWSHNDPTVYEYNVTYSERGVVDAVKTTIIRNYPSVEVCELKSGVYYDFEIVPRSPAGYGAASTVTVSTEQRAPPIPLPPDVLNTTDSYIAVALNPVVQTSATFMYGYLLSVDDVTSRDKRALSQSNTTCPGVNEIPGTVVKNFSHSEMLTRYEFIVGDGQTYGSFENKPLTKNNEYDIYYIITSYFEDICKYNYVKTRATALTIKEPVTVPTTSDDSMNIGLIIGIVVLGVLIIVVIVVLILIWCMRRSRSDLKYVPYTNDSELDINLKMYKIDDYNPQKYWNTIHSLRESRYIVAGVEFLPFDNKRIMNGGHAGMGDGAPVITFHDEFSNLPHGPQSTNRFAKLRGNDVKNRFHHLLPYDHSRVILEQDIHSDSDYINANFIKGYRHQHAYIAAQSPFDQETVLDFWRMIYQYEVRVVVMMSNLVEDNIVKCTKYWPEKGRAMYGGFVLEVLDEQEYAAFNICTMRIRTKETKDWQVVYIFDLTYWPEHGVPDDPIPLLEMRRKVNTYQGNDTVPIVVHCGTGVSRSGVYIAIDSLLDQYEAEGRISVYSLVRKMRKDRPAMVRTLKQYIFIYEAIFDAMYCGDTLVCPEDLKDKYQLLTRKNPMKGHSLLHGQYHLLTDFTRKLFPTMCSSAFLPTNYNKNRFIEIVPPDNYRPILGTPGGMGRTDYINAVFLDSHRQDTHYLITQTPLHTTVIDFWKLVYDHDVHTIVMMEPMLYEDDTCAEYWPEDHKKQYEPFFVETSDVYQQENITIRNLKLTSMMEPNNTRQIRQFQFNSWTDTEFVPKSKSMLLDVIDLVNDWQLVNNNEATPILVHCKDGATHSGLFIAVSVLCEKIIDEGEVDLFHTVKSLKRRRTQIVDTLDQYRFCYKALWDFINMRMPGGLLTDQMSKTRSDRPYNSLSLASYAEMQEHMPY